jgi:gallate dioxygenase
VSFFMLEKLGAVVGVSNLHIYAAMRGETLEQFRKTRNTPGADAGLGQGAGQMSRPAIGQAAIRRAAARLAAAPRY